MSDLSAPDAMLLASRGELDPRSLWFILTDVMNSVERIRRRFEKVAERAPREAALVREAFKRHRQLLDLACRQVAGPPAELKRLSSELGEASSELDRRLSEHREAALVNLGPTRLAGVNSILQMIQQNRSPAALGAGLAQERNRLERGLSNPELPEPVQQALTAMHEHVGELLLLSSDPTLPRFREVAQDYFRVALAAQETFAQAEARSEMGRGPTPNSALNHLIHQVRQGQPADPQDVLGDIAGLRNQLASVARMLTSPRVTEIAFQLDNEFDRLEEAIEGLQPGCWQEPLREILLAFEGLSRAGQELRTLSETEGKTPCVHCGQLNRSDIASCSRCGAVLPRVAMARESLIDVSESGGQAPPMTQNLKRIVDAISGFESGTIGRQDFQDQVAWFRGLLARTLELWPTTQQPPTEYLEALQDIEAGLTFLEQAEGSGVALDSGRALLLKGAARAHSVAG